MQFRNQDKLKLLRTMKDDYNYNEAIKTLRTNIQFCGSNIKAIMLTSSMPDEGKTDVSMALAVSLAQIGKKVLFLDADIRKSILIARYQIMQDLNGLSQYLSGQKDFEDILYHTSIENMDIIFSGPYSPNPAELLEDQAFAKMFDVLKEYYDYIIVDTPPMANLIDGAIIARYCDGAIMVIESGAISYRLEQKVKNQIEKSGCRILGVVMNKVDLKEDKYQGRYGKYSRGGYGKYMRYENYDISLNGKK